jgi:hypothetical protein
VPVVLYSIVAKIPVLLCPVDNIISSAKQNKKIEAKYNTTQFLGSEDEIIIVIDGSKKPKAPLLIIMRQKQEKSLENNNLQLLLLLIRFYLGYYLSVLGLALLGLG